MKWDSDSVSNEQLNDLRSAAEKAWGDDTRAPQFVGHPDPCAGQCYVTSRWLANRLGGHVGEKEGHYFFVSPDHSHVIDLTGDQYSMPPVSPEVGGQQLDDQDETWALDPRHTRWQPGPILYKRTTHPLYKNYQVVPPTDHPRAQMFERRAEAAIRGHHLATWQPGIYSTWQPGQQGKGLMDSRGNLFLWPIDHMGQPHHQAYALENELEDTDEGWKDWSNSIEIAPSGHYTHSAGLTYGQDPDGREGDFAQYIPTLRYVPNWEMWWKNEQRGRYGKLSDYAGSDPYPGDSPEAQERWKMNAPMLHDEPGHSPSLNDYLYTFFLGNGQFHISPEHNMCSLATHASFNDDVNEPFAVGDVRVTGDNAKWYVASNMSGRYLHRTLSDVSATRGWNFDGMFDLNGQELSEDFGPRLAMWYKLRDDGHLILSRTPLPRSKHLVVQGKTAYVDEVNDGLRAWAKDANYKLAEWPGGGDMTDQMKNREHLDQFNRMDPNWEPERVAPEFTMDDKQLVCGKCGEKLDGLASLRLHHQAEHGEKEDRIDDGHFPPVQDFDNPLGFGTYPVPNSGETIAKTIVMPLADKTEARRFIRFAAYDGFLAMERDSNVKLFGAFRAGQMVGYLAMREHDDEPELLMVDTAKQGHGVGSLLMNLAQKHYGSFYTHTNSKAGERLVRKMGMVNVSGQRWRWAKGKEPKDLIEDAIPFVYNIDGNKDHKQGMISIGYAGQSTHDVHPEMGEKFTPGGIVEGYYQPGGKILIVNETDTPWSVYGFAKLWYALYPQMEITSVEYQEPDGKKTKLASNSIGTYLETLVHADPAASRAFRKLKEAGGHVYVVGGAVRDALRGKTPRDLDLVVSGLPGHDVDHALSQLPGRVDFTGKRFGVYRYRTHGQDVEIALPRQDKYEEGKRGRGVITVNHELPIEQDLMRRDFKANSMAVDLDNGQLIDPAGGAQDIEANRLSLTHPDSFREDPTRLVRALTMHGQHGLIPDENMRRDMEQHAPALAHESPDAMNKVIDKMMTSHSPANAIRLAHETGVLKHLFPEVEENWNYAQDNKNHAYPIGEHLTHALDNVSQLTDDPDVRLAALYHDVGKPASRWTDDEGQGHYYEFRDAMGRLRATRENSRDQLPEQFRVNPPRVDDMKSWEPRNHELEDQLKHIYNQHTYGANHEDVGARMLEDRMRAYNYPVARINRATHLVQHHMFPNFADARGARKFLNRVGDEHAEDLLNIREADQGGKGVFNPRRSEAVNVMRSLVDQARQTQAPTQLSQLAINGRDILNMGIPPSPQVGQILNQLTNDVVDDPTLNEREALLQRAQQYIQGSGNAPPTDTG